MKWVIMDVATRIKNKRKVLNLSCKQVADMINEPASNYIEWENGRKITGEKVYPKLCRALNMSLSELIIGTNNGDLLKHIVNIEECFKEIKAIL